MTREPSWRRVAEILAERVGHAAAGAGSNAAYDGLHSSHAGCTHSATDADPDNCPFCADRAAFQVFQAKVRQSGGTS